MTGFSVPKNVKISVYCNSTEHESLNRIRKAQVDTSKVWLDVLRSHCGQINLNPEKFVVRSKQGSITCGLFEKVEMFINQSISESGKVSSVYPIYIVKKNRLRKHVEDSNQGHTSPSVPKLPPSAIELKNYFGLTPMRAASLAPSSSTSPRPKAKFSPPSEETSRKGKGGRPKGSKNKNPRKNQVKDTNQITAHGSLHPINLQATRTLIGNGETIMPLNLYHKSNNEDRLLEVDAWETATQDSQADLIAEGVSIVEIKDAVVQRMISQVTNADMLRIKHELASLFREGKWMRFSQKAPYTANMLSCIFDLMGQ